MSKPITTALIAATSALLLAATAYAGLPRPRHTDEIDVPRSIAGVELGMSLKRADREWGRAGDCGRARERRGIRACVYEGRNPRAGAATIESARRRKVSSIAIRAGLHRGEYVFRGRLLRLATRERIGLGSSRADVRKAYPRALPTANRTGFIVAGPGRSYLTFQTLDRWRVTGIALVDGEHQGRVAALDSASPTRP
ncbi:MAG: hypothetical protein EDQ89_05890 [Acidobacteria bacterium]|nr:MAG: hypothetical protein EDQ89_05890 [Acidobacteriota bacterium]